MQTEGQTQGLDDVVKSEVEADASAESSLPDKYKGKSPEELVRMHQEAEKLIGRHASELGELRKWADTLIQTNLKGEAKQEEDPDFFVDPKAAVKQTLEKDPLIKDTVDRTRQLEARLNLQALKETHPDYEDLVSSPDFQEWVGESKYRLQLFKTANANWDYDAANELFSTFKALKGATKAATEDKKAAVKRASVPSGGQTTSVEEGASRKIYRRADIIQLMKTDPKRYSALQPEIMKAYQEGRVR